MKKKPKKKIKLLCPEAAQVEQLNYEQAVLLLQDLIVKLDDLGMQDFFGTEGWRKYLGYAD